MSEVVACCIIRDWWYIINCYIHWEKSEISKTPLCSIFGVITCLPYSFSTSRQTSKSKTLQSFTSLLVILLWQISREASTKQHEQIQWSPGSLSCNTKSENRLVQFFHWSAVNPAKEEDILFGILPTYPGNRN